MIQIPNTFGLDVKARSLLEYRSEEELLDAIKMGRIQTPYFHIGSGSNLLFLGDYDGTILHSGIQGVEIIHEDANRVFLRVGAGMIWDDLVEMCVERGWYGAENLSGIPGEVGASAVQNIGAYGVEAKDMIQSVETINIQGKAVKYSVDECTYGYRNSIFKRPEMKSVFVTYVVFELSKSEHYALTYGSLFQELKASGVDLSLRSVRQLILKTRNRKLPDPRYIGNAGSFFKNPLVSQEQFERLLHDYPSMPHYAADAGQVKLSAAWLIDQCGWKGKKKGKAGVYEKQALVLVNLGGATGHDIIALAECIQTSVRERFGVVLSPEVNYVGK